MQLMNNSLNKTIFLLTLFVGGLIWLLMMLFIKIFITNLKGKSIWNKRQEVKEVALEQSFS